MHQPGGPFGDTDCVFSSLASLAVLSVVLLLFKCPSFCRRKKASWISSGVLQRWHRMAKELAELGIFWHGVTIGAVRSPDGDLHYLNGTEADLETVKQATPPPPPTCPRLGPFLFPTPARPLFESCLGLASGSGRQVIIREDKRCIYFRDLNNLRAAASGLGMAVCPGVVSRCCDQHVFATQAVCSRLQMLVL